MIAQDSAEAGDRTSTPPLRGLLGIARPRGLVRYILLFITAVLLVDSVFGEKGVLALLQARREFGVVERALNRARGENEALREDARRLREDPTAIEELARRELGLIKPGEKLFIVKDIARK